VPIFTELLIFSAIVTAIGCVASTPYASGLRYATIGHGDLVLSKAEPSAIEDTDGMILLGWPIAFFVAISARDRTPGSPLAAEAA
jgi:hypothetical protein